MRIKIKIRDKRKVRNTKEMQSIVALYACFAEGLKMTSNEFDKLLTNYLNYSFFTMGESDKNTMSSLKIKESNWLTSHEAAAYLKIPIGTVKNWSSNGKLPFVKLGRLNRYSLIELEKLLQSKKRGVL